MIMEGQKLPLVLNYTFSILGLIQLGSSVFGPKLDTESLLRHYMPMLGVANYNLLALAVLNPRLVRNLNARELVNRATIIEKRIYRKTNLFIET